MIFTHNGDQTTAENPKEILEDMMTYLMKLNSEVSKCYTNMANIEIIHYHMNANGTSDDDENINDELKSINTLGQLYFDTYYEKIRQFKLALIKFFEDNDLVNKYNKMMDLSYPYLGKILDNYIPTDNNAGNIERYMVVMNNLENDLLSGCTQSEVYANHINPKCISACYDTIDFEKILTPDFCKLQSGVKFNPEMDVDDVKSAACTIDNIYNHAKKYAYPDIIPSAEINPIEMIKFINIVGLYRHFLYSMMLSFVINWNDTFDLLEDK